MLEVILSDQKTVTELGAIAAQLRNPQRLLKIVGRRGANELKAHFRRRDTAPNKLGGRRTHFWRQIADGVNNPVLDSSSRVRISINDPDRALAHKINGGTIRPDKAKALTIPVDPEAHGRTVKTFQQETGIQLFLLRKKGGGLSNLLAGFDSPKHFTVYYVLMSSVTQDKDPEALPKIEDFGAALLESANDELELQIKRGGTV